ncbi:HAD family hydrolase, partial [Lactobacillus sp. UMNPBX8]
MLPEKYFKMSSHYYHHLEKIKSFSDIHDKILKFAVQCPDEKTDYFVQLFKDNLSQYSGVTSSGHGDIDIIQPDIHKANGLKELGDILGIKLSEMCAFGDGGNDLEMLREVGDGVAMKNVVPALLEVANHVTDT